MDLFITSKTILKRDCMNITELLLYLISNFFIATGTILITYGGLRASYKSIMLEIFRRDYKHDTIRREFTDKIIFGLEFYIAADIIETILAPSTEELILLGAVVGIRTILGYFLSKEAKEYHLN